MIEIAVYHSYFDTLSLKLYSPSKALTRNDTKIDRQMDRQRQTDRQ